MLSADQCNFTSEEVRAIFEYVSQYFFQSPSAVETAIIAEATDGNNTEGFEIAERVDLMINDLERLSSALRMLTMGDSSPEELQKFIGAVNQKLSRSGAAPSPDKLVNAVNVINQIIRREINE